MRCSEPQYKKYVDKVKQIQQRITKADRKLEYITWEETHNVFVCVAQGRGVKQGKLEFCFSGR